MDPTVLLDSEDNFDASYPELASESHFVTDNLEFPFHGLADDAFDAYLFGGATDALYRCENVRGNYIASYILAQHRIRVKASRGRWTNLEAIFVLPMELLVLIFQLLHPIDLYHIIQTTRTLRNLLLSKTALQIWEKCFLAHSDIPFYPKDVSPPKWVSLLFGPGVCYECGYNNITLDVTHRQRKCYMCWDLFDENDAILTESLRPITDRHPVILVDIWRLVRKTYSRVPYYRLGRGVRRGMVDYGCEAKYSLKDFKERVQEMAKLLDDVSSGIPGAHQVYDNFVQDTAFETEEYLEHAKICTTWASDILTKCVTDFDNSIPFFYACSTKTLVKRGHDPRDIATALVCTEENMKRDWRFYTCPKLTKKSVWELLPMFTDMVDFAKNGRLLKLRQDRLTELYMQIAKTNLKPDIAPYLPSPAVLHDLPVFDDYLHGSETTVDDVPVHIAEEEIPRFVDSVIKDKKNHLIEVLAAAGITDPADSKGDGSVSVLELAAAVFSCYRTPHTACFVGWEDAGTHMPCLTCLQPPGTGVQSSLYKLDLQCQFKYSIVGRRVLDILAELLGVDLRFARAKDLDAMNARFICKMCFFLRKGKAYGMDSMDWRQCLNHTVEAQKSRDFEDCRIPAFDVASDELTKSIHFIESPYPSRAEKAWSCNHCSEHFHDRVKRAEAITHVKTIHGIRNPAADKDFFYYRTERSPERRLIFVGLDANSNHRCLRCPERKNLRVWLKEDLFKHLVDKHMVEEKDLSEGVDWMKIKPVNDETWIEKAMRAQNLV